MPINNYGSNFNGPVYQSERDQFINAGHNAAMSVTMPEARRAATDLYTALNATRLQPWQRDDAQRQLADIIAALHQPAPDRGRIAGCLDRLTGLLKSAGALATGGAAVVGPLEALARWLGEAGAHILRLLAV